MGVSAMCGHTGGIVAPLVMSLGAAWGPLPIVLYGAAALLCGASVLFLPETLGRPLPQGLGDLADLYRCVKGAGGGPLQVGINPDPRLLEVTHTHTHTNTDKSSHRQTDRQTDRRTHTHTPFCAPGSIQSFHLLITNSTLLIEELPAPGSAP